MGLDHKFFQLSNGPSPTKHSVQISKWHIGKKHIHTHAFHARTHTHTYNKQRLKEREREFIGDKVVISVGY